MVDSNECPIKNHIMPNPIYGYFLYERIEMMIKTNNKIIEKSVVEG